VIVEILNEDGSMARRPDLEKFAQEHDLKIGTIADLIQYRIRNEKTVEQVSDCVLPTKHGDFRLYAFQDVVGNDIHLALVMGNIDSERSALVRVHVQNSLCDLFESTNKCGWPLREAMDSVAKEGEGVIVVLRNYDTARDIINQIETIKHGEQMEKKSLKASANDEELRTIGVGAQMLTELGVRKMRVMSAPKHLHALAGFGLEVTEFVNTENEA
jgi:3,4-dihydroxy 2-butanone 4-phosphate synthase/GTP cyclohydrolase II